MNLYPPIGRKNMAVMNRFNGISTLDPYQIAESMATVGKNLDADGYPAMKVRKKLLRLGGSVIAPVSTGIQGIFNYRNSAGSTPVTETIAVCAGCIMKWNGTTWTLIRNISGSTYPTGPIATNDVYATNFMGYMIFSTGATPVISVYDGLSYSEITPNLGEGPTSIKFPNYITTHENRLFLGIQNRIHCSGLRDRTDWTGVNTTAVIYTDETDGELINGILSGNNRLLVFKPNNMYELFGVDSTDFRLVKVTDKLGAVNGKCMVNMDGITYFLHTTGVYAYGGGRPKKISDTVHEYFDNWTDTRKQQAFVGTDGTRLYVNLGNDKMLVWHSEFNAWYEWNNLNARCMLSEPTPMFGDIYNMVLGYTGIAYETSVAWEWVSKPINTGALAQKWRLNRLFATLDTSATGTVNVYLSKTADGNDWTLVRTIAGNGVQQYIRTAINTSVAANAKYIRIKLSGTGDCTVHELIRESRIFPIV